MTALHVVRNKEERFSASIAVSFPTVSVINDHVESSNNFSGVSARVITFDQIHDIAILLPVEDVFDDRSFSSGVRVVPEYPSIADGAKTKIDTLEPRTVVELDTRILADGETVYTSGFPLGLGMTTTSGTIASSDPIRLSSTIPSKADVYLVDMRINHGNSGGPVFSLPNGKVVGLVDAFETASVEEVNAAHYNSGIGCIIPARYIAELLQKARNAKTASPSVK